MAVINVFDLTMLTDKERGDCGDPPSAGDLCAVARARSGGWLRPIADQVGVSHVTVLAWERHSDERLVDFWRRQGYIFPENMLITNVVLIRKSREFVVNAKIIDHGVIAEWSGMKLVRRHEPRISLDEHEYRVDEERGIYRFSKRLHGRRSIAVSYSLR